MFDIKRTRLTKTIIIAILLASLTFFGCTGPRGWPGVVANDDTLFVGSMDGRVLALNPASGARVWDWKPKAKQTGGAGGFLTCTTGQQFAGGAFYGPPVVANGLVYMGGYVGIVYAIDAARGVEVWRYDIGSTVAAGIAVDDGTVFVGSSNGKISALDAGNGTLKWEFPSKNQVWATPAVADGIVYFGSLDHNLYALYATNGAEKWIFPTGGGIASTPLLVDGVVYIGSFDKKFYALYADTGTPKWVFDKAGNWFWSEALYGNGTIYTVCLDHHVYALDAGNGTMVWSKPFETSSLVKSSPVISGGVLVVASEDGKVYGLDLKTGQEKWPNIDLETKVLAPLYTDGEKVYINAESNRLYALDGETGRQNWSVAIGE